ncbi:hypothetical protein B0I35DRAFT_416108 [Stachybotrys elegans]|uniref:Uncharacterized protein n=1 Tax=Stachybotrys elegans TaxID=80388 RepID=A0A8K0SXJ4_9HYPO|nr:hypothetical protein B0I35DRAFT_416108 [Stachybotrys elegans]
MWCVCVCDVTKPPTSWFPTTLLYIPLCQITTYISVSHLKRKGTRRIGQVSGLSAALSASVGDVGIGTEGVRCLVLWFYGFWFLPFVVCTCSLWTSWP